MTSPTRIEVSPDVARAIAKEAYIFGFAPVMAYRSMHNEALDAEHHDYSAPFNELGCKAALMTAADRTLPGPNADTPTCLAWLDLRAEPQVLHVPAVDANRFFDYELEDFYTHNFGYAGTFWTGNGGGTFLIAGPHWQGSKPEGVEQVFRSDTNFVFNFSRIQLYSPDDLANVAKLQRGFSLQPLSEFLGDAPPSPAPDIDFPVWDDGAQYDERLFGYLDFVLTLLGAPLEEDSPLWERMAMIGLSPQSQFNLEALPAEYQQALRDGAKQGLGELKRFIREYGDDPLVSTKILGTRESLEESARENYGHDNCHLIRAAAAELGIFGNIGQEAIYRLFLNDADDQPLDASQNDYTLTFAPGDLPPVRGFWSLSMYDEAMFFVDNPLDRYLLNSRMLDQGELRLNDDGSLTFYISADSPGAERESNWLPAPDGPFRMIMRVYGPSEDAQKGKWTPPRPQKDEVAGRTTRRLTT